MLSFFKFATRNTESRRVKVLAILRRKRIARERLEGMWVGLERVSEGKTTCHEG